MKVVLVEDNTATVNTLTMLLASSFPELTLVGSAPNVSEGLHLISRETPDLVFLDVEMPDGTGFDLLKNIPQVSFQVIFITAHEKYALKAIKFSALDFLLKPIDQDEFVEAVEKAKRAIDKKSTNEKVQTLIENLDLKADFPSKIVIKDKYGIQVISVENIIRLESSGSYTIFRIEGQENITVSKGLKEYENLLSSKQFFRSHQSHLINLNFLSRYDRKEGDQLFLTNGDKIPLANRKKERLLEILKSI